MVQMMIRAQQLLIDEVILMGLRFRKSINLGGGFRINLSKSGVGYSWGAKGYRVTKQHQEEREKHTAYLEQASLGWMKAETVEEEQIKDKLIIHL